jgi:DNA repair ATPase RecN
VVGLLAAGVLGYLYANSGKAHEAELARLREANQQELARQTEELDRLRSENKEIERLRAGSQEVVRLRADAAQLRNLQKEQQTIRAENQQLKATLQQFQQVGSENSHLRNQNQQLQGVLADRASIAACVANLKMIEGVKTRWATDLQKQPTEVPLDADLFGPGKYLPLKPACPNGGIYTVGPVQAKPTCSVAGHSY